MNDIQKAIRGLIKNIEKADKLCEKVNNPGEDKRCKKCPYKDERYDVCNIERLDRDRAYLHSFI